MHALFLMLALAGGPFFPVHGTVLGTGPHGTTIIRNDPVTQILPSETRAYLLSPKTRVKPGTGIDGIIPRSDLHDWTHAQIAARFVPGLPQSGDVFPLDYGSALPHTDLIDQTGHMIDLATAFPGKVVIISFVFTRCPDKDECPLISSKFTWLEHHLDPKRFHLVEISLDPVYDSPAVLAAYAKNYDADPSEWSILDGEPSEVQNVLNRFGISSLRVSDDNFLHNDKVFLSDRKGRIADIIQTLSFAPQSLQAQAEHLAGMTSNPIGRLSLALVASVVALCGGSQYAGIVLLDTVLIFLLGIGCSIYLAAIARRIWGPKA